MLNYEPITNNTPHHEPSPLSSSGPTRLYLAVSSSSSSSSSTIAVFVCHRRHHHHHGVGCCLVPPAATVILILVVQRCCNPTNDGIDAASPPFSSPPPSLLRPLCPLDRPWRHLGPACGVDALRYNAASAAPARAPLFEKRDNCTSAAITAAAMPQSPLRRLALDLRFSGRHHQSARAAHWC